MRPFIQAWRDGGRERGRKERREGRKEGGREGGRKDGGREEEVSASFTLGKDEQQRSQKKSASWRRRPGAAPRMQGTDGLGAEGKVRSDPASLPGSSISPSHCINTIFIKLIPSHTPPLPGHLYIWLASILYTHKMYLSILFVGFFFLGWNANCLSYIMQILQSTQIK